jgi:hypothetical protein
MIPKIVIEGTAAEIRQRLDTVYKGQGIKWAERRKQTQRLMRNFDDSLALKAQQSFRDSINAAGVCSFGENPRSILAWSHYADSHRGVCLQFEVARSLAIFGQALPVNYSEEYPTLNWVNQSEKIVEVLLTKYIGWKYEEESRIIIQESAGQFIDFQPAALSGIIIGCSASEETVAQLNELIHERISRGFPAPRLYRAFADDGKYRLLIRKENPALG